MSFKDELDKAELAIDAKIARRKAATKGLHTRAKNERSRILAWRKSRKSAKKRLHQPPSSGSRYARLDGSPGGKKIGF